MSFHHCGGRRLHSHQSAIDDYESDAYCPGCGGLRSRGTTAGVLLSSCRAFNAASLDGIARLFRRLSIFLPSVAFFIFGIREKFESNGVYPFRNTQLVTGIRFDTALGFGRTLRGSVVTESLVCPFVCHLGGRFYECHDSISVCLARWSSSVVPRASVLVSSAKAIFVLSFLFYSYRCPRHLHDNLSLLYNWMVERRGGQEPATVEFWADVCACQCGSDISVAVAGISVNNGGGLPRYRQWIQGPFRVRSAIIDVVSKRIMAIVRSVSIGAKLTASKIAWYMGREWRFLLGWKTGKCVDRIGRAKSPVNRTGERKVSRACCVLQGRGC